MIIKNVADYFLSKIISRYGIDRVFLYPGGTIAPLVNSALKFGLEVETFKTEQGAGYAALSHGYALGIPQLLLVTSGPGMTNAISCVCDSFFDSVPLLVVSGQISTKDLYAGRKVRQLGFQQVDGVSILSKLTKFSKCISKPSDFSNLDHVLDLAADERGGPIYFELPMDVQLSDYEPYFQAVKQDTTHTALAKIDPNNDEFLTIRESLLSAHKPLALIGAGGISSSGAHESIYRLLKKLNLHFVTSFRGVGFSSYKDPLNMGYLGHTGHERANRAVYEADWLLVLGSRLDVRQTGTETKEFSLDKAVYFVNNDQTELDACRVDYDLGILREVGKFADELSNYLINFQPKPLTKWANALIDFRKKEKNDVYNDGSSFAGREIVEKVSSFVSNKSVAVVTGVGSHQHWVARHFDFAYPQKRLFTSAGHGTMGFDVPAAVGVSMTNKFDVTLCFVGDGSIMHNICELRSAVDRNLNIIFIVFRNKRLGIVSQFQKITFGEDPTTNNFHTGDLCVIANGFGLKSKHIDINNLDELEKLINVEKGPRLVTVDIPESEDLSPMLLGGSKLNNLWTLNI